MATTAPATIHGFAGAMAPNVTALIELPHSWQNLLPGVSEAPHEAQLVRWSAAPQLLQNLPVAALPQPGHFVVGLAKTAPHELTCHNMVNASIPLGTWLTASNPRSTELLAFCGQAARRQNGSGRIEFPPKERASPWGDDETNMKDF